MKWRLMRANLFKCKLICPHEPPFHARSNQTVRIRNWPIVMIISRLRILLTFQIYTFIHSGFHSVISILYKFIMNLQSDQLSVGTEGSTGRAQQRHHRGNVFESPSSLNFSSHQLNHQAKWELVILSLQSGL